jgi:hypothetical protein
LLSDPDAIQIILPLEIKGFDMPGLQILADGPQTLTIAIGVFVLGVVGHSTSLRNWWHSPTTQSELSTGNNSWIAQFGRQLIPDYSPSSIGLSWATHIYQYQVPGKGSSSTIGS